MSTLNLVSWLQLALLHQEHAAGCWYLKRWQYRVWPLAGKLVTDSRQPRMLSNQEASETKLVMLPHQLINMLAGRWRDGHLRAWVAGSWSLFTSIQARIVSGGGGGRRVRQWVALLVVP